MKITAIQIEGFGIFAEACLAPLPPGLIVINAANGGGKTTLRDFLRACLFTFPRQNKDVNRYERENGAHGGAIEFALRDGSEFRLNFDAKTNKQRLARLDGITAPEPSQLFGSASRELYQNIFAIGLSELQDAKFLSGDQIHAMIGGFGSGGSGKVFQAARGSFIKDATDIFKPGGQNPLINKALSAHEELAAELTRSRAEADHYWSYETQLDELKQQIAERAAIEAALRHKHLHLQALKQGWPDWTQLARLREELAAVAPDVRSFPTEGTSRLAALTAETENLNQTLAKRDAEQKQSAQALNALSVNEALLLHTAAIDETNEGCRLHEDNLEKRAKLHGELGRATATLREETAALGPAGADHLDSFDSAVGPMAEMAEAARLLTEAARGAAERANALDSLDRRLTGAAAEAEAARAAFAEKWPQQPPEQTAIDGRLSELSRIRAALAEVARLRDKADHAAQTLAAATEALAQNQKRQREASENVAQPITESRPSGPNMKAIAAAIFVAGLLIAGVSYQTPLVAAVAFVVCSAIAILCLVTGRPAAPAPQAALPAYLQQDVETTERKLGEAREQAATATAQLAAAEAALTAQCQAFNQKPMQPADCDDLEGKLMQLRECRRLFEAAQQQLHAVEGANQSLQKERAHMEQEKQLAESGLATAQARWDAWLRLQQLEPGLSPAQAEAIRSQVEKSRLASRKCAELQAEIDSVTVQINLYSARLTELLTVLGRPIPEPADLKRALAALRDERDLSRQNLTHRTALSEGMAAAKVEIEDLRRKLAAAAARTATLLQEAGAATPDDFAARAAAWSRRQTLEAEERACIAKLVLLSAPGPASEKFMAELAALDHETLESHYAAAGQELEAQKTELAKLHQELGRISNARESLANNDRVAELQQALEASQAGLQDLADEWAARRLAFWLMEKARAEIETARQPLVLQSASRCLSTMSGGRFTGIVQPLGSSELHVLESDGRRRDNASTWNTALKEKTYLSLRFGLIDSYTAQAEPLPIILDDALVNLDPTNIAGALRCIDEMAGRHQIFYLTCHPHALRHFARLDIPPAYFEIRDGAFHEAELPQV